MKHPYTIKGISLHETPFTSEFLTTNNHGATGFATSQKILVVSRSPPMAAAAAW